MTSTTIFLAQLIGPTLIAAAIGFLAHPKFYKRIMKDYEAHEGLSYTTGMIVMLTGIAGVVNHNIWEWSAAGIITLLLWGALIKGATFLIVPNWLFEISNSMLKNKTLMQIAMVIMLIAGAYLSYVGFFM